MKTWPLVASLLIALALQAGAATPDDAANVGQTVARLQSAMAQRCAAASASDILNHALSCTCGPQALEIAWPAASRSRSVPPNAVLARMGGAMNACIARSAKQLIAGPCAHGIDPFADDAAPSTPAVAAASCKCANAELDKFAPRDPAKDADAASARFAAGEAVAPAPTVVLSSVQRACETVKAK